MFIIGSVKLLIISLIRSSILIEKLAIYKECVLNLKIMLIIFRLLLLIVAPFFLAVVYAQNNKAASNRDKNIVFTDKCSKKK